MSTNVSCRINNVPPSDTKLSVKGASKCPPEIVHVDTTNLYFSQNCSLCRDQANASNIPICNTSKTAGSGTHSEKENKCHCEFDDCILVLGRDWAWIALILGYTVPKGVHFCKDCLCRLSDLQKGATHTPNPLPKYKDFVPQNNRFGVRTFEQLRADHLKYILPECCNPALSAHVYKLITAECVQIDNCLCDASIVVHQRASPT